RSGLNGVDDACHGQAAISAFTSPFTKFTQKVQPEVMAHLVGSVASQIHQTEVSPERLPDRVNGISQIIAREVEIIVKFSLIVDRLFDVEFLSQGAHDVVTDGIC